MNVALQQPWTTEAFLRWEEKQALRYEFDGARPCMMAGGTAAHAAIQRNLITALAVGLRGKPCQPYGSELKIRVGAQSVRYPDAFVVCSPVPLRATVVADPAVIFEIVSDSSAAEDFVVKNAEYRGTPSVLHYVVLQQTTAAAIMFSRRGEDWVTDLLTTPGSILRMPAIGLDLSLAELYAGLDFESEAAGA